MGGGEGRVGGGGNGCDRRIKFLGKFTKRGGGGFRGGGGQGGCE